MGRSRYRGSPEPTARQRAALDDAQAAAIAKRIGNEQDAEWNILGGLARCGEITENTAAALREVLAEARSDPGQASRLGDLQALIDYVTNAGQRTSLPGWGTR
jgi:uncharacterized protein YidB (DUF937 family)